MARDTWRLRIQRTLENLGLGPMKNNFWLDAVARILERLSIGGGGGGTTNHAGLVNLGYAQSGHTDFQQKMYEIGKPGVYRQVVGTPTNEYEFNDLQTFINNNIRNRWFNGNVIIEIYQNVPQGIIISNVAGKEGSYFSISFYARVLGNVNFDSCDFTTIGLFSTVTAPLHNLYAHSVSRTFSLMGNWDLTRSPGVIGDISLSYIPLVEVLEESKVIVNKFITRHSDVIVNEVEFININTILMEASFFNLLKDSGPITIQNLHEGHAGVVVAPVESINKHWETYVRNRREIADVGKVLSIQNVGGQALVVPQQMANVPIPPASGNYQLRSNNGVLTWVVV